MNVVVDASAIGAFLLPGEDERFAALAAEVCRTDQLHVPPVWRTEVASLLVKAFRQGRINDQERLEGSKRADVLAETATMGAEGGIADLVALAQSCSLRAHDATYLRLAMELRLPLLTNDRALMRAAPDMGVPLLLP